MGAVLWQSGWGYILPGWHCPRVSSDGATVSPDPPLSQSPVSTLQQSKCRWARVSLFYLVSCVNLSILPLILSLPPLLVNLIPGVMPQDYLAPVHLVVLLLQFQLFCLRLGNPDLFTQPTTLSRTCCFRHFLSLYRTCCLDL